MIVEPLIEKTRKVITNKNNKEENMSWDYSLRYQMSIIKRWSQDRKGKEIVALAGLPVEHKITLER